jgi:Icc-related predicted phosphoesterase
VHVAVLADIHGNLPALDAVLGEVDVAGADAIVVNGDIAVGPMPAETLDRGRTGAYRALLGPDVVLKRTAYDLDAAVRSFERAAPDYPDLAKFAAENIRQVHSDAEALAAFSGR